METSGSRPLFVELHQHLDGSLRPETLLELLTDQNINTPGLSPSGTRLDSKKLHDWIEIRVNAGDLREYLKVFHLTTQVMQDAQSLERIAHECVLDWKQQNIVYGEVRFAPHLHFQKGLTGPEVIDAVLRGLEKGQKETGIPFTLILCQMRHESIHWELLDWALEFKPRGTRALDLAGNEADFPASRFKDFFLKARKLGLGVTIHAGEAAGPQSIKEALEAGAQRIGHGTRLVLDRNFPDNSELLKKIKAENILLECCYTSNLQTQSWSDPLTHPLMQYWQLGLAVTLCTDNPLVSMTDIAREWEMMAALPQFQDQYYKESLLNSVRSAFLPEDERLKLEEQIQKFLR